MSVLTRMEKLRFGHMASRCRDVLLSLRLDLVGRGPMPLCCAASQVSAMNETFGHIYSRRIPLQTPFDDSYD